VSSPIAVIVALSYVAHFLGFEATLGLRGGHKDIRLLVEAWLRRLEPISPRGKSEA
jgi:hypothetical protein